VNAVRIQVTEKDKSQAEEFRRIWSEEISQHAYLFDRVDKQVEILATLTRKEFNDYF